MTSQPQVPGAAAVYLYREELTDDQTHTTTVYVRLKVLTEAGVGYADVPLDYLSELEDISGFTVVNVAGRTIHSDGTVIPFTGKPYKRTLEKVKGYKVAETVFTMPGVNVGSIIEYRYTLDLNDLWYAPPRWDIQQDLYLRKGYFRWNATARVLYDSLRDSETQRVAWAYLLPPGAAIKLTEKPAVGMSMAYHHIELNVHDVAPAPHEEFMLPLSGFTYRVRFYYAADATPKEFWKNSGKSWAKSVERFIGSPENMKPQVQTLVADGDTDTIKLQKIYAAVMSMDNTALSRQHEAAEDKAHDLKATENIKDIWARKRGTEDELTELFVGLARATGMTAYVSRVTDRDKNLFWSAWLTLDQLDDDLAIVMLDGKEQYFDPGQRYCPFGQLAWKHTGVTALRELAGGSTGFAATPEPPPTQSQTQRIGDLTMDEHGAVQGTLKITWLGAPALQWRQQLLRDDVDSVKHDMREWLQVRVPSEVEPEITTIENLKAVDGKFHRHGTTRNRDNQAADSASTIF